MGRQPLASYRTVISSGAFGLGRKVMRRFKFLLVGVLLAAGSAGAQVASTPFLTPSSTVHFSLADVKLVNPALNLFPKPAPAPQPQLPGVIGVFENFNFQAYV